MTQIIDAVTQHSKALYAQAEGKTAIFFVVDVHVFKYLWMHHAAAANLQPARNRKAVCIL